MKKLLAVLALAATLAMPFLVTLAPVALTTGCTHLQVVTNGVTNVVTMIDPVKLQQAKDALEPACSSVLRRAILRSPQHAKEIGDYARAVGTVFAQMVANNNFTPTYLIDAANKATADLQATAPPEVIDGKNAAIALYKIFLGDQLMVSIPDNSWAKAICQLFSESIDQALKDAGQTGLSAQALSAFKR